MKNASWDHRLLGTHLKETESIVSCVLLLGALKQILLSKRSLSRKLAYLPSLTLRAAWAEKKLYYHKRKVSLDNFSESDKIRMMKIFFWWRFSQKYLTNFLGIPPTWSFVFFLSFFWHSENHAYNNKINNEWNGFENFTTKYSHEFNHTNESFMILTIILIRDLIKKKKETLVDFQNSSSFFSIRNKRKNYTRLLCSPVNVIDGIRL